MAEAEADYALSIHGVRLHVLTVGDSFVLKARRPKGAMPEPA